VPPAGLLIIGRVAAGTPILAVESLEGHPEIHRLIEERAKLFVLRLKGDSMVDPQIDAVDDVIVWAQPWIEHGDVCGVVTDQEVAVKTIRYRRTDLWLKPEGVQQWYPPIRLCLQQHVYIVCKVIGKAI
jgi:repressor LexA